VAIGAISISTVGAQTAPAAINMTAGTVISVNSTSLLSKDYGIKDVVFFPSLRAVMFCDGLDFAWHIIDSAGYLTGPLAPSTAPTLTPTAARATSVLTVSGTPANDDLIQIGLPGWLGAGYVYAKTTLDTASSANQVKIDGSAANFITNLQKLVNGTGTQGTEYWSGQIAIGGDGTPLGTGFQEYGDVEVSTSNATTITFRAMTYGSVGNSYNSRFVVGSNFSFSATPTMSGGTAGTGTAPEAGDYDYGYAYVRMGPTGLEAVTGISPTTSLDMGVNSNVAVAMTASLARDGIGYYRPMRTLTDGTKYYKLDDTASTPYTDDNTDLAISGDFAEIYDASISRPFTAGYPDRRRFHATFKGAIFRAGAFLAGKRDDATTASVTGPSPGPATNTVTLSSGSSPKEDWIGRSFRVDATTDEYVITNVVESTRVLTLNRLYVGATNATASYTITDERDAFEIDWSAPLLPNNYPVTNSLKGVYSPDPTGVTGLTTSLDRLCVHTRTGCWDIIGEIDAGFQIVPVGEGMGAFTNLAVVNLEGSLYWLGPDGVFARGDRGIPRSLSSPEVTQSGQPLGISGTIDRINLDAADGIVGQFNPTENVIRWWVPLDESPYNSHVIVYDTQTGAFTLDDCGPVTAAGLVIGVDGRYHTVVGDAFGCLWQLDLGTSDGGHGTFEPVTTVSSYAASTLVISLSGTPALPTTGLEGARLIHVVALTGAYQHATIRSTTADTITLVSPLTTAPVSGDKIIVGGIEFSVRTGHSNFAMPDGRKTLSSVTVDYTEQDLGQLWCAAGYDINDPTIFTLRSGSVDVAALTNDDGEHQFTFRRGKGRRFTIQFLALTPGYDVEIHGYVPVLRVRSTDDQVS
jgi:hypothetical protein